MTGERPMGSKKLQVWVTDSTISAIKKRAVFAGKNLSEITREMIDSGLENRSENERLTFPSCQFSPGKEDPRTEEILTTVHEMVQILRKTLNPTTYLTGETDKKLSSLAEALSKFPDLFEAQGKKLEEKHRELSSQILKFHEAKINESLRELLSGIEKKIGGLGERLAVIENQQKVSMAAISSNLPALATPPSGAKKSQSQVAEKRAWKQVWEKLMDLLSGESSTGWVLGTLIFLLVIIAVALWI
jgi:hypothetical protein